MSKEGFSITDLQQSAKKLNSLEPSDNKKTSKQITSHEDSDIEATLALENLYSKYQGDLDKIFDDLKSDPSKAKKPHHRPKDKIEFAKQYLLGYYSIIDSEKVSNQADFKSNYK